MSAAAGTQSRSRFVFVALMLALTVFCAVLGVWQVQRLGEKEALIAVVADRLDDPPQPLPPAEDWADLAPDDLDFRPLSVAGRLLADQTALVFTSLANPRGEHTGPGYWVMAPVAVDGGGMVFLNLGFIPQADVGRLDALLAANPLADSQQFAGIGRRAERAGPFTPAPDTEAGMDWIRDPTRLAALVGIESAVAPAFIDLPAGPPGALPQGGETVVEFPNNHLGYALTWFGFALLTPILLVAWWRRQRLPTKP